MTIEWFKSRVRGATVLTAALLIVQTVLSAQEFTTRCDPAPGSLERLTETQQQAFLTSQDNFIANKFAEALAELRALLAQVPPNTPAQVALAERAAEAALFAGNRDYAIQLLKPIKERDGTDCPARTLLARAYAENGQSAERDAEISALIALHQQAPQSPAGKLDFFLLEQHGLKAGGVVTIAHALRPFGPHNTYLFSEIYDASGAMVARIELDSDDEDQVYFKEKHPDLAAKGDRQFSLDAFAPADAKKPDGKVDHALIQFYEGKPTYDAVRERILAIAERSVKNRAGAPHKPSLLVWVNYTLPPMLTRLCLALLLAVSASAQSNGVGTVVGTWKLVSAKQLNTDGTTTLEFGAHPSGYLTYTADGHMHAIITEDARPPLSVNDRAGAPEPERARAFATSFAYAGTYTLTGNKVTHKVLISTIPNWVGQDFVRRFQLDGDRLTIVTAGAMLIRGVKVDHVELVWQRDSVATPR